MNAERGMVAAEERESPRLSEELEQWLTGNDEKLGSLISTFADKSFALLLVVLLGVPALPLPTGGATHVFEIIAMLVCLQLVATTRGVAAPAMAQARVRRAAPAAFRVGTAAADPLA